MVCAPFRVFTLSALIILAFGLAGCGGSADNTADQFMSLLVGGKQVAAQELLSKDMRSFAAMMGGVSNKSLNHYYRAGNLKGYQLTEMEKAANFVRYKVVATTADGKSYTDFIDLVREEGKWKVARF